MITGRRPRFRGEDSTAALLMTYTGGGCTASGDAVRDDSGRARAIIAMVIGMVVLCEMALLGQGDDGDSGRQP